MQSDRELLELAAKAAGVGANGMKWSLHKPDYESGPAQQPVYWNPLADDGQALRLAVKLGLCIESGCCTDDAPIVRCGFIEDREQWPMHPNFPDRFAATRRAIVRAAAAVGAGSTE